MPAATSRSPASRSTARAIPFLGLRGIRLSLRHPDVFRVQLRALAARRRATARSRSCCRWSPCREELEAARALLEAAVAELAARRRSPCARPPLGIMVEVPAAAIAVERFDAAFFSIGSNDLTQYVTAAGRDIAAVADLADPLNPAVLRLDRGVVARTAATVGREVSLCGDAGGDPGAIAGACSRPACARCRSRPPRWPRPRRAIAAVDLGGRRAADGRRAERRRGAEPRSGRRLQGDPAARARQAAVRHAPAPGRRRSARTAASSRRSPIPPIRCRSRRSISRRSSRSAISRRPSGAISSPPIARRIRDRLRAGPTPARERASSRSTVPDLGDEQAQSRARRDDRRLRPSACGRFADDIE